MADLLDGRDTTSVAAPLSILRSSGSTAAVERVWRAVSPGRVHRAYCLDGAGEAATSSTLFRTDGTLERMSPVFRTVLQPDDVMHRQMVGGGGFGSAPERDPLAVARDLFDDRVPVTAAREIYGVVAGHDRQLVLDATDARRRSAVR